MSSFCPGKENRKLKRCAWRPVPPRPPTHSLRPSLRAPQSGSQWTWASRSRQKAQLCHQGDAKGLRFWATSACADIRGMKGTQEGFLWADVSRGERSRDATLDPALRKVRVTFAGRAWRLQGLELRTKRRAAGWRPPEPPPRSWTRGPQPRRWEVDTTAGPTPGTDGLRSAPGTSQSCSGNTRSAREEGPEGAGRPRGGESWPRPPRRGFTQGSPTKRRRTPRFQSHFKSDYHTGPSVLIIDFRSFYPGEGNGNALQYSCLENPMDRGASQATVHGIVRVGHDLTTKSPPPPPHIVN